MSHYETLLATVDEFLARDTPPSLVDSIRRALDHGLSPEGLLAYVWRLTQGTGHAGAALTFCRAHLVVETWCRERGVPLPEFPSIGGDPSTF